MGSSFPPADWPTLIGNSWLAKLDPRVFRVLFSIIIDAAPEARWFNSTRTGPVAVPVGGLVTTLEHLSIRSGVGRTQVRSAISILGDGPNKDGAGVLRVAVAPRGYMLITVSLSGLTIDEVLANQMTLWENEGAGSGQACESTPPGLATQGASRRPDTAEDHAVTKRASPESSSQELADGSGSGLALSQISDPSARSDLDHNVQTEALQSGDPLTVRIDQHKDSKRIWAAADYIRSQLLEIDPGNIVRKHPWGPGVKHGVRAKWATEIRLMIDQDKRDITEIARSLSWVFTGQGATEPKYRIIVESAASLRSKYDRIQTARRRQVQSAGYVAPAPASHKRIV